MKVHSIYDGGEDTLDRFTVYFSGEGTLSTAPGQLGMRWCLAMSEHPFHPLGFCQHSTGMPGRHNGRRISLKDLPEDCRAAVALDLGEGEE
jgi:hypothetical protein